MSEVPTFFQQTPQNHLVNNLAKKMQGENLRYVDHRVKTHKNSHSRENLLLGMGNPLLDISANVDKQFLQKYNMKENNAILADESHKNLTGDLIDQYKAEFIAGGSVQNTLRVAQWLLEKPRVTTFFGCVGTDKYSQILKEGAQSEGVNVIYQLNDTVPTGTCAVLITGPNRSLCADLGAANCFTIDHIKNPANRKLIEGAQYFYISVRCVFCRRVLLILRFCRVSSSP